MAWTCTGKTNVDLIANMRRNNLIHSDLVAEAMKKVDRANYVPDKEDAYVDAPQPIGYSATISAPHMHAHATENLLPFLRPGMKVLDIGSGSGYLCAVFHHLVSPSDSYTKGKVVGIDHIKELTDGSIANLRKDGLEADDSDDSPLQIICGDGRLGYPSSGPYNAIHVGAAAPVLPEALVEQLARPGRMFIPVEDSELYSGAQSIWQIDKNEQGEVTKKKLFGVMYVPLTDKVKQWRY